VELSESDDGGGGRERVVRGSSGGHSGPRSRLRFVDGLRGGQRGAVWRRACCHSHRRPVGRGRGAGDMRKEKQT
jgi:hypothetical protein